MAAITSAVVAVAGIGLSIGQMIHQSNLKKQADQSAQAARDAFRGIEEVNALAGLQVSPMGMELAKEQQARRESTLVKSLQEGGDARSALGATTAIAEEGRKGDIELAAKIGDAEFDRDVKVLTEDAAIEKREAERLAQLEEANITGAGLASKEAREGEVEAATSAITGATILGGKIVEKAPGYGWKA
jgi:hypothetical protein